MEWKEVTLEEIGTIVGGATPSTKRTSFYDGDIPWLTPKDLSANSNKYIFRGERNITAEGFNSCSCKMLPKGSVLFSSRAPIGYVAIAASEMCTNQGFKSVIPNEDTDSEFLYYLLKYNKDNIVSQGSGTTFAEVSGKTMKGIEVVVPKEVDDQRRIASILSSLDRKIELNNKINADLEEMAQTIFKNWFVDFEPFKDGKFVDSELGMIPEGWKVGTLDEIFSLKYGKNLSTSMILEKGDYPVYGANGIIGYYNEYNCDKYSVLVTSRGNGSGDVSRTHHPKSFITNNSFIVESLEQYKYIELPFINGLFNIIDFKSYCSGSAQPQLTNKAMRNICIISPPMEIVIKYCEMLETLFSHIECVIAENSRLSLLRDTLLPRLMSGEIEIPE
ncbi:restriction endonuclease subunit S [Prevotella stercorea]|uniref:restriction endonuclease subunit S n=1 Tax=Leyella stercorea TaxID=363265 RepID=UPI001F239D72|nr:restriction endonuclease subunit S [Leyella stercorea]MCF2646253.1 restriction endonuclease subunit S [Leyella stercorea]